MKRYKVIIILMFFCLFVNSCISFKVQPPFLTKDWLEEMVVCRRINDSGELLEPLERITDFSVDDDSVICFVRLKEISEEVILRWRWYSSDGTEVRDTGEVAVNENGNYLEAVTAYDRFRLDPGDEKNLSGEWTVAVFLNSHFLGKQSFRIGDKN